MSLGTPLYFQPACIYLLFYIATFVYFRTKLICFGIFLFFACLHPQEVIKQAKYKQLLIGRPDGMNRHNKYIFS